VSAAGQVAQATDRLGDGAEADPVAVWPGLAEAGDADCALV
jgi:hypothetical protein